MAAPLQYLETLREAQPELSESCNTLADLYKRQLWDQLTLKLEQFVALPIFQAGDALIHLYHNFITEFELKIDLLKLAHFAVIVSGQYAEKEAGISYLDGVIEKLRNTKEICIEQPILYVKMRIALLKLEQGNKKECKELIDEGKSTLDSMTDINPSVSAEYDRVSSQYYKWGNNNAPLGENEEDVDENEGLGSKKGDIEATIPKGGDGEPIGSIIKRLRSRNRRKVKTENEEETGGKGMLQTSGVESENISKGEMMTLSEIQMLAKNKLNQGRKKLKEKSTLAEIMDNLRDKEKDKVGKSAERRESEHADQIEEIIGSQKKVGEMEGDYEIVPKRKILTITKVYQRRTKLYDKGKPFNLKEKEKVREKDKKDNDEEEKENGHNDTREDSGRHNQIDICVAEKDKESDMEEEEKIDEKRDTEKKREENEHEDVGGQETLAEMQMLAKKKLNEGRRKLKQGKEKEQKDRRDHNGSQKQVEEVNLEKENGLEEEIVSVAETSGNGLLDRWEEDVSSKKQMDEKEGEGEEVTLAEMRTSAKKLNQEKANLQYKDKNTSVKKKQQDKDDGQGKDDEQKDEGEGSCKQKEIGELDGEKEKENDMDEVPAVRMSAKKLNQERTKLNYKDKDTSVKKIQQDKDDRQKDEGEGSCRQKGIEEQDGEEDEENEMQELPAVRIRRKRERYSIPEVDSPDIGKRTRMKRDKRKTSKLESLYVLGRRDVMAKDIEMEEGLHEEEEMAIVNLRKKRAWRKPADVCSFEVIKSASNSPNSDAETIKRSLEIVSMSPFDFYDFNKDRIGRKFQKGQVWAIYDDKDGMPRHYAVIDEVVSVNPFQVQLNWLDFQDTGVKTLASRENTVLPIACGSFKVSISVMIKSGKIFSHIADFERAAREVYKIYPKKGSVWAMFNTDVMDIVVFLTSYSEIYGLSMAYLERVNGFKTIYKRREIGAHAIKFLEGNDFRLLSHQIPARKLSGEEVSGLPKHCWELDPASLPESLAIGSGR